MTEELKPCHFCGAYVAVACGIEVFNLDEVVA